MSQIDSIQQLKRAMSDHFMNRHVLLQYNEIKLIQNKQLDGFLRIEKVQKLYLRKNCNCV